MYVIENCDCIIVGSGVFGSTIARTLLRQGRKVLAIDDKQPLAGTGPSGFVMKPSWFSALDKGQREAALKLLAEIYPMVEEEFHVNIGMGIKVKMDKVLRIPRKAVLALDDLHLLEAKVLAVKEGEVLLAEPLPEGIARTLKAPMIVVAAGYWSQALLGQPIPGFQGKRGISHVFRGQLPGNVIRPFSPYRQVVAYNCDQDHVWAGDGTAIIPGNWDDVKHPGVSLGRVQDKVEELKLLPITKRLQGIRPYADTRGDPCLLQEVTAGVWICTGGGKNGTIAAGWAADRLRRVA